ncbi:glycosyltransferase family 4 protein [uncultured Proteiniphilum sp.]|uniref:glycosyltransferase family 4 protein n=1 Tax=uncultured Proteiniphilum sp. TaxID=497637 RepID=UPI00261388BB|nr:glycosyltransferase family 4 protein [uncultured Proteiniphilum sp.]
MDKIAIVVQRYGKEVSGGAEEHARMLAERLKARYGVDVLTSRALNFPVWDNYYPAGEEVLDGIRVLRFTHERVNPKTPRWLGRYLRGNWKYYHTGYTFANIITLSLRRLRYRRRKDHDRIFEDWIENDGPVCKGMISYIEQEKDRYKAFIFLNYPFYPTYFGLQKASGKSILIPLAHDEPMLYLSGYNKMFALPGFIMYNTESEKHLVESAHPITRTIRSDIAGVGFDRPVPAENTESPIGSPYFVYIGRIDIGKGCLELIDYFSKMNKPEVKLVMIGKNYMDNPVEHDNIIFTGFVDEAEKLDYLQHCEGLIIPSRYESLSMVTLEAMSVGKPVLANGRCEVLRHHIEQSQAGFVYYDGKDFAGQVNRILNLSDRDRQVIAQNGRSYVERNYQWESILKKFDAAIDYVGMDREASL